MTTCTNCGKRPKEADNDLCFWCARLIGWRMFYRIALPIMMQYGAEILIVALILWLLFKP